MEEFYTRGIPQILKDTFKINSIIDNKRNSTPEDKSFDKFNIDVEILNNVLERPTFRSASSSKITTLYPYTARLHDLTYSSALKVDAVIRATAFKKDGDQVVKTAEIKDFKICSVPVMVKTKLCNLYQLSRDSLFDLHEDPTDPGGYFIIKGFEYVIDSQENIPYNLYRMYKNVGYKTELARCEIISKAGDSFENSSEVIITMLSNNQINVRVVNQYTHKEDEEILFPFYTIFKILGVVNEREIIEHIVMDFETDISKKMQTVLERAMNCNYSDLPHSRQLYSQLENLIYVGRFLDRFKNNYDPLTGIIGGTSPEETTKYITNKILDTFDNHFLPHVGTNPDSRLNKARYFGQMIHSLILTEMEIIPSTDRDSYSNKRVHPPGVSFSKAFKSLYSHAVVNALKKSIKIALTNTMFENIDWSTVFKQAINGNDFEKSLSMVITNSDRGMVIGGHKFANHVKALLLNRKNPLTVYLTLRQIVTSNNSNSNKSSARANEMRRVHSSYAGYICIIQSADTGEKVGMIKQMACSASISPFGFSQILKDDIYKDPDFIPLSKVAPADIVKYNLGKVMVNGEWIGLVRDSNDFIKRYRDKRRYGEIDRTTSIHWNFITDEITLWVDVGRIMRPLLIVYNNNDPYSAKSKKTGKFEQDIAITPELLKKLYTKEIDNHELQRLRIIEYITPEEQERLLIAPDYNTLVANKHNEILQYTHCDIPQAILGLAALTSPYSNHDQITRVCYQTNQVKITCSWFSKVWNKRHDKETALQYTIESPLVTTMAKSMIEPCGSNIILAIACYGGFNQEDSMIFNRESIERGLLNVSVFGNHREEFEPKEEIATPDQSNTRDINPNYNYNKLVNGLIREGSIVREGDVLIAKRVELEGDDKYKYADKSIIYKESEPAIIEKVLPLTRNQNDTNFCKVAWRVIMPVRIGDKFSTRHGQKGVCGMIYPQCDMPFTEDGITPDVIMNPHCMPSRMTIGQMIEGIVSLYCANKGCTTDGTIFSDINVDNVCDRLEKMGIDRYGQQRIYNGETGEAIVCEMFIVPTHIQRLQKFVKKSVYAVSNGPTDAITRQPVAGKTHGGGLRIGEMERDVILACGASRFLREKFFTHSDGFDIYICRRCGDRDSVVVSPTISKCRNCNDLAEIIKIQSSVSTKVVSQVARGMGIKMKYIIEDPKFYEQGL
jgi:DNA-directed RNA polymerase beta subunit